MYVAGHNGLAGSAIVRALKAEGFTGIVGRTHAELDLENQHDVEKFFASEKPEYVFLAAAKVGGIHANNTYPADFIFDNLQIQNNVIHSSYLHKVKKLCFLGSSCIYPKFASQPIKEEYFLDGKLEPTNDAYAVAKIAGIKMCQAYNKQYGTNFISVMPTNLYGPNDNFDLMNAHVLPAFIRKFIEAKKNGSPSVTIWGSGKPKREFLYVEDMARACVFLMKNYDSSEIINIGTGEDVTILELAHLIGEEVGFKGNIEFDASKPDGTPRKLLDVSKINGLGWRAGVPLREGIRKTVEWFYTFGVLGS
ncbi:MAG TPA: GDP-L-fucose synthase [Bacteroidota bacterium]|nr:GDP-L-fucose synthase [Bacteroidota bacterium]